MPDPTDATNASLEAYNTAVAYLDSATATLAKMQSSVRPPDEPTTGHDTGGKQYDLDYKQAQAAVEAAQTQAATASRQYATLLEQQANQQAQANTPEALASAERGHAMAAYYQARADGLQAKDAATAKSATDRAAAALTRANTAGQRVDAQNNLNNAQADLARATAAKDAATTPTAVAAAQAQIDKATNDIATANAKLPGELAGQAATTAHTVAQTALTGAQASTADANTQLLQLQAQQLQENDPLVKAHLQAQIDQLQTQTANLGKPSLEPGYQNAAQIPMIVKDTDGKWTVQWVPNNGQQMTSTAALKQLGETIGLHLGDGPDQIPVATAKDLFSIANDTYKTQTDRQVANNQGATIGAGLLQGRQNNTTSQENTLLGLAGNKNFGLGGAVLPSWSSVHNEVLGNMTQAGGGQSTYDMAQQLVHQALPQSQGTPVAAAHVAVVQQMLDAAQPGQGNAGAPPSPAAASGPTLQGAPIPADGTPYQSGLGGFQAPVTQIAPDGTVTVQHTPPFQAPGLPQPYEQSGARRIQ